MANKKGSFQILCERNLPVSKKIIESIKYRNVRNLLQDTSSQLERSVNGAINHRISFARNSINSSIAKLKEEHEYLTMHELLEKNPEFGYKIVHDLCYISNII